MKLCSDNLKLNNTSMLYSSTVVQTGLPAQHSELCPSFLGVGSGARLPGEVGRTRQQHGGAQTHKGTGSFISTKHLSKPSQCL